MRNLFIAALVVAAFALPAVAQETTAPAETPPVTATQTAKPDPFLDQIGDAMARDAAQANTPQDRNALPGAARPNANALRSAIALVVVVALILLVYGVAKRWGKRVPLLAGSHLGKILGRVYLDRSTALHFVQVGEKILLIGANTNSVSLLGEFSSAVFNGHAPTPGATAVPFNPDSFLAELKTRSQQIAPGEHGARAEEDEIASLRGDIQRLQRYLRDENREHED